MKKTILICSNAYPPRFIGGAELIAHYQARALQRLGHKIIVFTGDLDKIGEPHQLRFEPFDQLPVYRTRLTEDDYRHDTVNFYRADIEAQFAEILRRFRPDVVHAHNLIGLSTGILSQASRFGARTVITLHDYWGFCYKNTIIKRENEICRDFNLCHECLASIACDDGRNIPVRLRNDFIAAQLESCDYFVSPSQYLARQYVRAGFPLTRMRVLWNGIDLERFSAIRKTPRTGAVRFTFVGYLGPHKGVNVLADAIGLLATKTDRFIVNFVGVGELQESLKERFAGGALAPRVRLLGRIPNEHVDSVFADTDVQVLPSIWPENQPVSITEAMASRTAVIASSLGGTPELVDDSASGYLTRPGDPNDLANAMMRFIDEPDRITAFGERGFEKIRGCSFDSQVRKLLKLYETPPPSKRPSELVVLQDSRFAPELVQPVNDVQRVAADKPVRLMMAEWFLSEGDPVNMVLDRVVCSRSAESGRELEVASGRDAGEMCLADASWIIGEHAGSLDQVRQIQG